ncbi:hypothetical protein [Mesorhizobium sp. KR1-2]|uniref:hypothetical protein n=1 Tax=Mesorhizobium sp. KR1-2 TaxID=3156609 RepID=UPI0032B4E7BA
MQLREIEQTLQAMLEAERAANKKQRWQMPQLFRQRAAAATAKESAASAATSGEAMEQKQRWQWPQLLRRPASAFAKSRARSSRRGDFIVAGFGLSLGLVCATFPWYIFFNPEKFGIQALQFEGTGRPGKFHSLALNARFLRPGDFLAEDGQKSDKLDPFTTSTLPEAQEKQASAGDQPFPAEDIPYRLVHVVNGRALIEDDAGLWVVQPGSLLPDSSLVASIEQRAGKWVLLTNKDKVVALTQ